MLTLAYMPVRERSWCEIYKSKAWSYVIPRNCDKWSQIGEKIKIYEMIALMSYSWQTSIKARRLCRLSLRRFHERNVDDVVRCGENIEKREIYIFNTKPAQTLNFLQLKSNLFLWNVSNINRPWIMQIFHFVLGTLMQAPQLEGGEKTMRSISSKWAHFFVIQYSIMLFFASRCFGVESTHCRCVMKMHWIHSLFCWLLYECSFSIFHCTIRLDIIPITIEGSRSLASTPFWCFSFRVMIILFFEK